MAERERIPGRRSAMALIAAAMLLAMATWFSASAVVGQLTVAWTLTPAETAWLTIAVQLGFVAGALISATTNLADVYAPRGVFAVSAFGAAVANALLVFAGGAVPGIALRFLTGAFLAGVYPPAMKVVATWSREQRGIALGVAVGALTLGSAMPHLVNSMGGIAWETVIMTTSGLTIIGGGVMWLSVRDGPFPFPRARFDPKQIRRVFGNRGVRLASAGYFGHMWELYAMWAWFLPFLNASFEASGSGSRSQAALGTFVVIGVGAVGCVVGGVMGDRWGRSRTTSAAMALSGACALTIGATFGRAPWLVLVVGIVWGISVVADSAQFSTVVTEVADPAYVGTALTVQLAVGFTLTVATIWLVPIVRDATSWGWAFAMLAAGPFVGIVAMQRLRRAPEAAAIAGGRG